MSEKTEVLEIRKRVLWFGEHAQYHVYVTRGSQREGSTRQPRFRWEAIGVDTGAVEFLSPVSGFGTRDEAATDAKRVLGNMGVSFQEVQEAPA